MDTISSDLAREKTAEHRIRVDPAQVKLGQLVVEMDIPWHESPFREGGVLVETFADKQWLREHCQWVVIDLRRSRNRFRPTAAHAEPVTEPLPPIPERIDALQISSMDAGSIQRAWALYAELEARIARMLLSARRDGSIDVAAAEAVVARLADELPQSLAALVWLTRIKEPQQYLAQHCINSAILCLGLAHGLKWSRERIETAGLLGLVHDVGKIALDPALLRKREALSEAERLTVRKHVALGHAVLGRSRSMPREVRAAARASHERPDGQGYPRGLAGNAIPVMARLVAIVDAYDAMTSERPYGQAMAHQEALGVLWRERGRQFEPALVEAFIQFLGWVPPGTLVRLSDGELAVVIEMRRERGIRPLVRVLEDQDGELVLGEERLLSGQFEQGAEQRLRIAELLPDASGGVSMRALTLALLQRAKMPTAGPVSGPSSAVPEFEPDTETVPKHDPESPASRVWGLAELKRLFRRDTGTGAVPADRPAAKDAPMVAAAEPMQRFAGQRALVVDDSNTVRQLLGRLLESQGFRVELVNSAELGLELARARPPDLVFLDILLPGLNGFAALRKLRKQRENANAAVVMMSGNAQATEQVFAGHIGFDDFIPKPFDEVLIRECLGRLAANGRLNLVPTD